MTTTPDLWSHAIKNQKKKSTNAIPYRPGQQGHVYEIRLGHRQVKLHVTDTGEWIFEPDQNYSRAHEKALCALVPAWLDKRTALVTDELSALSLLLSGPV